MDEDVAAWLRRQIARREWSQADLARRMGASPSRVSEWLAGKRVPSPASCERLADVLHDDLDTLLSLAGHRPPEIDDDDPERTTLLSLMRRVRLDVPERIRLLRSLLDEMIRADRGEAAR